MATDNERSEPRSPQDWRRALALVSLASFVAALHTGHWFAAPFALLFMAGYGYVEFAGAKDALFRAPDIRVGILLLAGGLHYPLHTHPAEEIYHPLTEGGLWRRGGETWRSVPTGRAIHHPPMIPHETKAGDRTLLALLFVAGLIAPVLATLLEHVSRLRLGDGFEMIPLLRLPEFLFGIVLARSYMRERARPASLFRSPTLLWVAGVLVLAAGAMAKEWIPRWMMQIGTFMPAFALIILGFSQGDGPVQNGSGSSPM